MSEAEAQDAFIIFDEAYEGNDVDAFYLGKSLIVKKLFFAFTNRRRKRRGTLDNDLLSFGCTQLIACCANTQLTGCPKRQIRRRSGNNELWLKYEENISVSQCQCKWMPSNELSMRCLRLVHYLLSDGVRIYYLT